MPFFMKASTSSKARKIPKAARTKSHAATSADVQRKKRKLQVEDEEISSDEDETETETIASRKCEEYTSEDDTESVQDKRLRLAKQYLAQIADEEAERLDNVDETDNIEILSARLKKDNLELAGKLHKDLALHYVAPTADNITVCRGHKMAVTCVVLSPDNVYVYSGSKDCCIIKWHAHNGYKIKMVAGRKKGSESSCVGHSSHILCISLSSDGKFVVSGDRSNLIFVWNADTLQQLHVFTGHRDAVSGLSFRRGTHQLFSASHDRTVKVWNVDEMAYVETLFGHCDAVTAIDCLSSERALTSGGRDRSVRLWKIAEESQFVFNGDSGSIDCACLIDESHFVSGSDDNSLSMWSVQKKKPIVTVTNAHTDSLDVRMTNNWITAVASLHYTDLVVSGSRDGQLRFWRCGIDYRSISPLFTLPLAGFVNSLQFSVDGTLLVAAVGQEHKLGRWWNLKQAKNCVCIIRLHKCNTAGITV